MTSPPAAVLGAFGAAGRAVPLPGGQGRTWAAGNVVLKPAGLPAEVVWIAEVLASLPPSRRFRVPQPVPASGGAWIVDGWEAWSLLPGEPDHRRWHEVLDVGTAFHQALAGLPRPAFLDDRQDPWTFGEQLAWGERSLDGSEAMSELLEPLALARRPIALQAQPVHGDLLGNVLFADELPPAVIDWPVYYRPPGWASAVVVVDALTWYGAPASLLDRYAVPGEGAEEWDQLLLRAAAYRIATNEGFRRQGDTVRESADSYRRVVELILARC